MWIFKIDKISRGAELGSARELHNIIVSLLELMERDIYIGIVRGMRES
jgi:hypothetical protein